MENPEKRIYKPADGNDTLSELRRYQDELDKKRKEMKKKNFHFFVGLMVVIFSLVGFIGCIVQGVSVVLEKQDMKNKAALETYSGFMLAVAAVDPEPFDDITAAPMEELVEIAVWSIIGSDLEPEKYSYSSDELVIPASEVESAFLRYFGTAVVIEHCSVTGYGYEFSYSADDNAYYIPLTTIEPLYTPHITDAQVKGDAVIVTLGLINTNSWQQNSQTGDMETPDPDKIIKVTLRKSGGYTAIGAIQTSARPEISIADIINSAENTTTVAVESSTAAADSTTEAEASGTAETTVAAETASAS